MISKVQENKIIEAVKKGASSAKEIVFETKLDYSLIIDWLVIDQNALLVERLSYKPIWEAKKKVLKTAKQNNNDAKWLLTHHKDSKADWSDRVEHTGKDGKDLQVTLVKFIDEQPKHN